MNTFIITISAITGLAIMIVLVFYNLYCQVNKQVYNEKGEYIGQADEPNDNPQVTSVPEKQIADL